MSDKERKTFTLDRENYNALKDHDNASALVNDLVDEWRRGGDRGTAALRMQLRQKKREKDMAEDRVGKLTDDIEQMETLLREFEASEDAELEKARDALENVPNDPDNPAVKNWAKKLGMEPETLLTELE